MIHELIDPKKKKNKTSVSGNTKTIQNSKNIFEYSNFESSFYENKNTEASSATFMPPWLRSSLGLNQRNVLSHATASSDQKASKIIHRNKAASQNEFDVLKENIEHGCCKEWKDPNDLVVKDSLQETIQAPDNAETVIINSERITASQNIKSKVFESKSSEAKFLGKGDWVKADTNVLLPEETEKLRDEDTKRAKLIRQKNSYKKRISSDQKPYNLDKSEIDFFLQMKAREVVENLKKKELHSMSPETRNLDTKLLVLGAKPHDSNNYKLKQQDIQWLQEMKNQMMGTDDFEGLVEHLTDMNLRDFVKNPELLSENMMERKREEKEDRKNKKSARESSQKCEYDERFNEDEGLLLSSDDEDNIKRFSHFLSKNEDLEEKKKCLEEVRSYFEKKRKSLTKRRCLNEEKKKSNLKSDRKEDNIKEKSRTKNSSKGMKSKFGICDEEMVEKAVEDTLQKFIESHHINATPTTLETMKRSIFHCMSGNYSKSTRSPPAVKKCNLDQLGLEEKDPEKFDFSSFLEGVEASSKEPAPYKEIKKKNFRTSVENSGDLKETNIAENEKFKRLRKEFDNFLHSVQFHIDFTNLKLQSVILEKEEQTSVSKNVQFVYNFTKKSLEQGKTGASGNKHCNDDGTQTALENEVSKRNVKVQAFEYKPTCEQSLQTEIVSGVTEATQTNNDQVSVREIKELKSYDVSPGLYRMVKSKEPGKFYLYPEPDDRKQSTNFSFVTHKRLHRKKDFLNVLNVKSSSKDRRYVLKERERAKLKKIRKLGKALVRLEGVSSKQGKSTDAKTDSLSCLYFRNLDQSHSGLFTPNKEMTLTENTVIRTDDSEDLGLGDAEQIPSGDNLGCFWFWNGEKISAGCDLKTHVENLLKEKLKEIVGFENQNTALSLKSPGLLKRNKKELKKVAKKSAVLHFDNVVHNSAKEDTLLSDDELLDERNKTEEEKNQSEETKGVTSPLFEEKPVRNVAIQNSERTCISINPSKLKVHKSKIGFPIKKKTNKGNLVLKHRRGKPVNVRKAENIVEAIEELKRMKLEAENAKNGGPRDSDSLLNFSLSTKESKNEADPLPIVFRHQESIEAVDSNLKNRLKKLVSLVNCENQRNDIFVAEDVNSIQNPQAEDHKHMALIETVLNKITNKDRESLWNDVRDFIKTRINRDRNDDDREVCIEIEQDLHKNDRGKLRDILAKGHYRRNEGDIEVEIDLTLDDLERILRQRQKNIRKRTLYRSNLSNKFLSTSSIQSEFTRDDFRRYQKYLESLTSGRGLVQEKEMKAFL